MASHFNRRQFINFLSTIPFIGIPFHKTNKARLNQIIAQIGPEPRIMVLYHDFVSALDILKHIDHLTGISINMPGTSMAILKGMKTITFHCNRPGATNIDALCTEAWREAAMSHLIIIQDPYSYGTFKVIKSRYAQNGEILNVFTHKRKSAVSNV